MNIVVAILIFGILVMLHELGHFVVAKRNGVRVYEFSIGMGPLLYKMQKKDTQYSLRAIPLGGYVRMDPKEEEDELQDEENFALKAPWTRIKILLAGPLMNILLAFVIMVGVYSYVGFASTTIGSFTEDSPAQRAGMQAGDRIVRIDNTPITEYNQIRQLVQSAPMEVEVERNGNSQTLEIQPKESEGRYVIGIYPKPERNLVRSVPEAMNFTVESSVLLLETLGKLIVGQGHAQDLSGPIGIVGYVGEAVSMGSVAVLSFMAMISLNLGIFNLLPIPGLDGSKILIAIVEKIRNKRLSENLELKITIAGMSVLLLIMVFVTYQDIVRLIN